ncbi:MAG: TorF family putative porin [Gammaproteobacteria bacterium]
MRRTTILLSLASACIYHPACAEESEEESGPFASQNFSSTIYLMNDYRFRGISNSDGPAIQGSLDWTYNGFYLGVWGSNTEFSDANIEIDYYGGYRWSWEGIGCDITGYYYSYPGEDEDDFDEFDPFGGQDADYWEVHGGLSYTFSTVLSPSVAVHYYYSPDIIAEDGDGHAVQGNFGVTLPFDLSSTGLGLYGIIGYQDVEGDKSSGALGGYDYVWWQLGTNITVKGYKLDLAYIDAEESDALEAFFSPTTLPDGRIADFTDLTEGTVLFTVSRIFF